MAVEPAFEPLRLIHGGEVAYPFGGWTAGRFVPIMGGLFGYHERATTMGKVILVIVGLVFVILVISGMANTDDKSPSASLSSNSSTETAGQENARESAESYLESGHFSRRGLIEQLSSEYGEGYSKADAIYAVNAVRAARPGLWMQQAAKAARSYLENQSFSRSGLIDQLESPYGEGFTHAQAVYGVSVAYGP